MRLGNALSELSRSWLGLLVALLVAAFVAAQTAYAIQLLPPSIERRSFDMASASTQVLVDTPRSTMIDLREDNYNLSGLATQAVLLGNVMASPSVRAFLARRAGVDPALVETTVPLTPEQPHALAQPGAEPRTSDILRRPGQRSLSIQVNPTVPVIAIYAEAPDQNSAEAIANGAVDGLRDYLDGVADTEATESASRIQLHQLGRATGGVINQGAGAGLALFLFAVSFVVCCGVVLLISRTWRRWRDSGRFEREAGSLA